MLLFLPQIVSKFSLNSIEFSPRVCEDYFCSRLCYANRIFSISRMALLSTSQTKVTREIMRPHLGYKTIEQSESFTAMILQYQLSLCLHNSRRDTI